MISSGTYRACASFKESGSVNGVPYLNRDRGYRTASVGLCPSALLSLYGPKTNYLPDENKQRATEIMASYVATLLPLRLEPVETNVSKGGTGMNTGDYMIRVLCGGGSQGLGMGLDFYGKGIEVVNPPGEIKSVCSFTNDVSFTFNASSLDVNGLTHSKNLNISCTPGTSRNYTLRLTGTSVINGRLNFGNGVSAQISINGHSVSANGSGVTLNNLVNQDIPLSATLVGGGSGPGVTNASGVLVLDAL